MAQYMLNEMLKAQYELDCSIYKSEEEYLDNRSENFDSLRLALIVEVGELLNERPDIFKFWKKTYCVNKAKELEELADVWHFALSILNSKHRVFNDESVSLEKDILAYGIPDPKEYALQLVEYVSNDYEYYDDIIYHVHYLTLALGYTFHDVYQEYFRKNAINHKRQQEGY